MVQDGPDHFVHFLKPELAVGDGDVRSPAVERFVTFLRGKRPYP